MKEIEALSLVRTALGRLERGIKSGTLAQEVAVAINALEQFQQSYYDFREICDNLYDGIHITDGEGKVLFINKAYTRTTGIQPEEIMGRSVSDIESERELYKGSVTEQVLKRREVVNSVAIIFKLDKEVLVTGTPVFDAAGNIKLVVTNTRDFPELKRMERQLLTMAEENKKAKEELAYLRMQQTGQKQIYYRSEAMRQVMDVVQTVANTNVTVLITGESGTGKELVANAIYQNSGRNNRPFIKVNCAAIPAELMESELFGYEEGAFTGARRTGKAGLFELANTGVLLLDEIGDMPLPLQSKLLRVLQERELVRIGAAAPLKLDIRVIASTNRDLKEAIAQGTFREDLFYRLNVVPIALKPLRERREDILFLAQQFCGLCNEKYSKVTALTPSALELLTEYTWPGNIRELENLIERFVVISRVSTISRGDVYRALNPAVGTLSPNCPPLTLRGQVGAFERELIRHTIEQEGSIRKAARLLGVDHSTLVKKCQRDEKDESR